MIRRITSLFLCLIVILCLSSCKERKQKFTKTFIEYFDTVSTVVGYEYSEEEFNKTCDFIESELKSYNELYDIYNSYDNVNNIKTINKNAGKEPVKVDKKILDLLNFSKDIYNKTDGNVNVALGSVLSIWHTYRENGIAEPKNASLPPKSQLEKANEHTDINNVIIDMEKSTVYLNDSQMSLDVGAVAKGYATQRIAEELMQQGKTSYALNFGGNIRTIGNKGDDEPWTASVTNPDTTSENTSIMRVEVTNCVFVTSGSYQRFYEVDGKRYHHIINPSTLYPVNNFTSVSVYTDDSGIADVLSTALFNLTIEDGKELLSNFENAEAMWVMPNGEITYTDGFEKIIIK